MTATDKARSEIKARPQIVLIAAVADNGVIGSRGALPWRLKSDMQRIKAITTGKPVVMGRKTFASIGRPLSGRTNIVVTRDASFRAAGAVVTTSFTDARAVALGDALRRSNGWILPTGWKLPKFTPGPRATRILPQSMQPSGKRWPACAIRPVRTTARTSPM